MITLVELAPEAMRTAVVKTYGKDTYVGTLVDKVMDGETLPPSPSLPPNQARPQRHVHKVS